MSPYFEVLRRSIEAGQQLSRLSRNDCGLVVFPGKGLDCRQRIEQMADNKLGLVTFLTPEYVGPAATIYSIEISQYPRQQQTFVGIRVFRSEARRPKTTDHVGIVATSEGQPDRARFLLGDVVELGGASRALAFLLAQVGPFARWQMRYCTVVCASGVQVAEQRVCARVCAGTSSE